jgi:hypothetical protein
MPLCVPILITILVVFSTYELPHGGFSRCLHFCDQSATNISKPFGFQRIIEHAAKNISLQLKTFPFFGIMLFVFICRFLLQENCSYFTSKKLSFQDFPLSRLVRFFVLYKFHPHIAHTQTAQSCH